METVLHKPIVPINTQQPFSFQQRARNIKKPPKTTQYLSSNVKGICSVCKAFHQRIKKFNEKGEKISLDCTRCRKKRMPGIIIEFPKELIPWQITGTDISGIDNYNFYCQNCQKFYADFNTFGAICGHKKHSPPDNYWCRLCCTKAASPEEDQPKLLRKKRINKRDLKQRLYGRRFGVAGLVAPVWQFNEVQVPPIPQPEINIERWNFHEPQVAANFAALEDQVREHIGRVVAPIDPLDLDDDLADWRDEEE